MDKAQMEMTLASALEAGTLAEQEGLAKEAVEQFENDSFGYYYLAEALVNQDPPNFPKAEVCLAKAIELTPDTIFHTVIDLVHI